MFIYTYEKVKQRKTTFYQKIFQLKNEEITISVIEFENGIIKFNCLIENSNFCIIQFIRSKPLFLSGFYLNLF